MVLALKGKMFSIGSRRLSLMCLLFLLCLLLALWAGLPVARVDPDMRFEWLRRSRNARLYVRPVAKTVLVEPADSCDANHRLLLLVTSAPGHFAQRQAIRDTWGHRHPQAKLFFFLGHEGEDAGPSDAVVSESFQFGDVIVESFADTYHNLTLKTLFMLKWAVGHCASVPFLLKTDDDMLINTRGLVRQLRRWGDGSRPLLAGMLYRSVEPYRDTSSKWYVPLWLYPQDTFPDFLSGTAYLMSRSAVDRLYPAALDTPLMPLEDVFLTGIVANRELGLPLEPMPRFCGDHPSVLQHPCLYRLFLAVHDIPPQRLRKIWSGLIELETSRCESLLLRIVAYLAGPADVQGPASAADPW